MTKIMSVGRSLALAAVGSLLLVCAAQAGTCTLRGKVADASGRPVSSVWVVLSQGGADRARMLTGDDGRYYLGDLQPGSYMLIVRRGKQTLVQRAISVDGDKIYDIDLP